MPTSDKTGACYTSLDGATVLSEVHTISGFPSRRNLEYFVTLCLLVGFSNGLREFWD
jgi:hypothetical protein